MHNGFSHSFYTHPSSYNTYYSSSTSPLYFESSRSRSPSYSSYSRSLSPLSFQHKFNEHQFFDNGNDQQSSEKKKPTSKSNITITRPTTVGKGKNYDSVAKLVELLTSKTAQTAVKIDLQDDIEPPIITDIPAKKVDDESRYSSFLSMTCSSDSSTSSSSFSSRSNSSISTVTKNEEEQEETEEIIELKDEYCSYPYTTDDKDAVDVQDKSDSVPIPSLIQSPTSAQNRVPALGLNITASFVHLVLLERYPQNIDYNIVLFQRYLLSLIDNFEYKQWSPISNMQLPDQHDIEANIRLFTLPRDDFHANLLRLQTFTTLNNSFILNIALTGQSTQEYQLKISEKLSKINLSFDIITCQAESYMIGIEFFIQKQQMFHQEFYDIASEKYLTTPTNLYPYLLIHAELGSTYFYIVHSSTKYTICTYSNLCYSTYRNLTKFFCQGDEDIPLDEEKSLPLRSSSFSYLSSSSSHSQVPSFDFTTNDLCTNCRSFPFTSTLPLTSFTRVSPKYLPQNYKTCKSPYYIYRGWSNRRSTSYDGSTCSYDVHTQTDDSYLSQYQSTNLKSTMKKSLLNMITMNIALTVKLIVKLYPDVNHCFLTGEFFHQEKQANIDVAKSIHYLLSNKHLTICQIKREPLIAALGCALPRVYFDIVEDILPGYDCVK
ncbi:unnamed protein product [Didymodactylos carnosus]|uniref:Uncharacterized protein n=1 Tax=Didymodactylos carnosus TaxID=1234261 RepID=A0A8S2H8Q5_9BILA|nr:unnamed protein product [Didymodactylos carnosus]CAF3616077.1 unnamed protein product [Didymodactylos carnosus]